MKKMQMKKIKKRRKRIKTKRGRRRGATPEKLKEPIIVEAQVELSWEEKENLWNFPDQDLIEKEALAQQEKEKLS